MIWRFGATIHGSALPQHDRRAGPSRRGWSCDCVRERDGRGPLRCRAICGLHLSGGLGGLVFSRRIDVALPPVQKIRLGGPFNRDLTCHLARVLSGKGWDESGGTDGQHLWQVSESREFLESVLSEVARELPPSRVKRSLLPAPSATTCVKRWPVETATLASPALCG